MRIAIDVNGVLRDTITKIQQVYEKWYIENPHLPESGYTYDIISPITSLEISQHLKFQNEDEVYDFLYTEHCMEIFGHAPSVAMNTFVDFDEFGSLPQLKNVYAAIGRCPTIVIARAANSTIVGYNKPQVSSPLQIEYGGSLFNTLVKNSTYM